jgi:hypothetical protein
MSVNSSASKFLYYVELGRRKEDIFFHLLQRVVRRVT